MANPYNVEINGQPADVYTILLAYGVTCPATGHAVKKLLCAGNRGGGKPRLQDLCEAQQALVRAIDLEMERQEAKPKPDKVYLCDMRDNGLPQIHEFSGAD